MPEAKAVIVVIDDDPRVRRAIARLLRSAHLTVEAFDSAEAFLRRPCRDAPACLVLDVDLPGLSGIELQRTLTETKRPIPIIFITAQGNPPMAAAALQARAIAVLTKPFDDQDLFDALGEALARQERESAWHQEASLMPHGFSSSVLDSCSLGLRWYGQPRNTGR